MSTHLLVEEAKKRSIQCTILGFDEYLVLMQKNGKEWYVKGSRTSLESSIGKTLSDQKELAKLIFNHFSIPSAKFVYVTSIEDLPQLSELSFPIIMKPTDGEQGKGVVIGIRNSEEAKKAFSAQNKKVLFEEYLLGTEYRIMCVNYKFVAAAEKQPAKVVGNGIDTISQLISKENIKRQQRIDSDLENNTYTTDLKPILFDDESKRQLEQIGYSESSIISNGEHVFVRKNANLSTGGEAWDVTDNVSEGNKSFFEKIARICNLNTIGIDVMCNSLSTPIEEQANAGIIEINNGPGLRMHHFPVKGKPRDIAAAILDMVEKELHLN